MKAVIKDLVNQDKQIKNLKGITLGLLCVATLSIASTFATAIAAVELGKESHVGKDDVMKALNGHAVKVDTHSPPIGAPSDRNSSHRATSHTEPST